MTRLVHRTRHWYTLEFEAGYGRLNLEPFPIDHPPEHGSIRS